MKVLEKIYKYFYNKFVVWGSYKAEYIFLFSALSTNTKTSLQKNYSGNLPYLDINFLAWFCCRW